MLNVIQCNINNRMSFILYVCIALIADAGDVGLRYSKMLYDSLAQVIYDNGLQGYDKELLDIKDNHTWLLKHFKDGKLNHFETVYKVMKTKLLIIG